MRANVDRFLANQQRYFNFCYKGFLDFGGPCVYFHKECLVAGEENFLSERHIEMLYATLTAWGMHRMGDSEKAKTKLTDWPRFQSSIASQSQQLLRFRRYRLTEMSNFEYSDVISQMQDCYNRLDLSVSEATIVANSKALHHLFPEFIPPIDRQYTFRFFTQPTDKWLDPKGKFKQVQLPKARNEQFKLFLKICTEMKNLADRVDSKFIRQEYEESRVTAPKALDNAIVNYVRITASELRGTKPNTDFDTTI
jgi:hypothetical protein